jgi:N-acetylglutamate synthase
VEIAGDDVALAFSRSFERFISAVPDGWCVRDGGVLGAFAHSNVPTLNGVWQQDPEADMRAVAAMLDRVAAEGHPYCLQVRADQTGELDAVANDHGMTLVDEIQLMVLRHPSELASERSIPELKVRRLQPQEALTHATVAAAGFEAPLESFAELVTPGMVSLVGLRWYVGEVDGDPVTTGLGMSIGDHVGVFNIATPPAYRGNGYGEAVTRRVVLDGFAAGAGWSWLQATESGYGIYERLGFRPVERWRCYVADLSN